jgi:hypothetical protein
VALLAVESLLLSRILKPLLKNIDIGVATVILLPMS